MKKPRVKRLFVFLDKFSAEDGRSIFDQFSKGIMSARALYEYRALELMRLLLDARIGENRQINDGAAASRYLNRLDEDEPFRKEACRVFIHKAKLAYITTNQQEH